MSRLDPIRRNYYDIVESTELAQDVLFYVGALLSFGALAVDVTTRPDLHEAVMILFGIVVIAMFALDLTLRLYLIPRAEDTRRQDFFGNACHVSLIHQRTEGYYNNDCDDPIKRMAAQVLENSLFSKEIALRMARTVRFKVVLYTLVWLIVLYYRRTDVGWIVAASQAVFSEQVLAKWLRLEWLRATCERTFGTVYRLFQSRPDIKQFTAQALDAVTMYETAKARAGITLSSRIFDRLNPPLSDEWDKIRGDLGI